MIRRDFELHRLLHGSPYLLTAPHAEQLRYIIEGGPVRSNGLVPTMLSFLHFSDSTSSRNQALSQNLCHLRI